jgi:hypothetical protein
MSQETPDLDLDAHILATAQRLVQAAGGHAFSVAALAQASGVVTNAFDAIPFTIITWPTGSIWMERI